MHKQHDIVWYILRAAYHLINAALYLVFYVAVMLAAYGAVISMGGFGLFLFVAIIAGLRLAYDVRKIRAGQVEIPPQPENLQPSKEPHSFTKAGRNSQK